MDGKELKKRILEQKRQKVLEIVYLVCQKEGLKEPKVNFNGCPQETQDQLAHYHPLENKICISTTQLYKLRSMTSVENTTYHELAHIFEQEHGSAHTKTKIKLKSEIWRPPRGVIFISKDVQDELAKQRANQKKTKPEKIRIDKVHCNYHLCKKKARLTQCPHCKGYFCKEHIRPVVPGNLTTEWSTIDIEGDNYHPCSNYVDFLKKQKEQQLKELEDAWKKSKNTSERVEAKYRNVNYEGFEDSPEAQRRRLIAELDETESKPARKRIIEEIGRLDIIIKQSKRQQQKDTARPPSSSQSDDLETVRKKLGIDISDKSHIIPKKKQGLLEKLKKLFGFE